MANFHNGQLYRYIELIEYGKTRRGMSTNDLKEVFGEWLEFSTKNRAVALVLSPRADPKSDGQPPAPWHITFEINNDGIVADYSITKSTGK